MPIPRHGTPKDELLARMETLRAADADWRRGRTFSLVYYAGEEIESLLARAYTMFMAENGLSPGAFPSLKRFEAEVVDAAAGLLGGGDAGVCGTMTSGGSESIMMAVKTARDAARASRPGLGRPRMIAPVTVHPAFEKAAHYFGVEIVHAPLAADFRVDVDAVRDLINDDTILLVGSAPQYPHGVIDPIEALGALARERGLFLHVDACVGGFLLPWIERLGRPVAPFDFRVPGVTSMSADLHKYGFAAKGASIVLYRNEGLRRHQFFAYTDWPGGLYGSPSMTGTRPGGAIAAAWAILQHLGEDGYLRIARTIMDVSDRIQAGIRAVPDLYILGAPVMSVFAFASRRHDAYALGDAMELKGWRLDRQQLPPCLHMMLTPAHAPHADAFLTDLAETARDLPPGVPAAASGSAAIYGLVSALPERAMAADLITEFMGSIYMVEPQR